MCQRDRTQIILQVLRRLLFRDWCHIGELPYTGQQLLLEGGVQDSDKRVCEKLNVFFQQPIEDCVWSTRLCGVQPTQHFADTMLGDPQELGKVILQREWDEGISQPVILMQAVPKVSY